MKTWLSQCVLSLTHRQTRHWMISITWYCEQACHWLPCDSVDLPQWHRHRTVDTCSAEKSLPDYLLIGRNMIALTFFFSTIKIKTVIKMILKNCNLRSF